METEFLKQKYRNLTQGTNMITSMIDTKQMDMPFCDDDIELCLIKQHEDPNEEKIRNIEYLIMVY